MESTAPMQAVTDVSRVQRVDTTVVPKKILHHSVQHATLVAMKMQTDSVLSAPLAGSLLEQVPHNVWIVHLANLLPSTA